MNPACRQCGGACCETIVMELPDDAPGDLGVWLELRGRKEVGQVRIQARCKALTNIGTCAIHNQRPLCCKHYQVGGRDCLNSIRAQRPTIAAQLIKLARENSEV